MLADRSASPPAEILLFFKALADESRLAIVRLLALTDLRVGEIVDRVRIPQNAVSYHLRLLRQLGLVRDHRSSLDARDVYYRVDLSRLQVLYQAAGHTLYPGMSADPDQRESKGWEARPLRVLILCTHNSARSQLAEGLLRYLGGDQVAVWSAGSRPTIVHPYALQLLTELGLDPGQYRAKPMSEFADQAFDYIITVCDRVRDQCPVFPDDPLHIHWSIPDPVAESTAAAQWAAFTAVQQDLTTRIRYLLLLPHPATGRRFAAAAPRPRGAP
ncbi:MAG: metalloregulator ArsR/SmtB family transcription factor [Chloroflexia bacterium]